MTPPSSSSGFQSPSESRGRPSLHTQTTAYLPEPHHTGIHPATRGDGWRYRLRHMIEFRFFVTFPLQKALPGIEWVPVQNADLCDWKCILVLHAKPSDRHGSTWACHPPPGCRPPAQSGHAAASRVLQPTRRLPRESLSTAPR